MQKESAKIRIGKALLELLQSNKPEKIKVKDLIQKANVSNHPISPAKRRYALGE